MSETIFYRGEKKRNFSIIDNTCLQDKQLSWKAKGLHCYLQSLPGDWKINNVDLENRSSDNKTALSSIIKELQIAGYMVYSEQPRNENGQFGNKCIAVYEKPVPEERRNKFDSQKRLIKSGTANPDPESPFPVEPSTVIPNTVTQPLLNTNLPNIEKEKTELTNNAYSSDSSVSLYNTVTKLFNSYPFDEHFASDVEQQLMKYSLSNQHINSYIDYVYKRAKLLPVKKSFASLFRKMALSDSITSDYKQSDAYQGLEKPSQDKPQEEPFMECPACHIQFPKSEYFCPNCKIAQKDIININVPEITARTKIAQMTSSERAQFDAAFEDKAAQHAFLTPDTRISIYRELGVLN